jgi:polysaccharide biosynthesis transport protein
MESEQTSLNTGHFLGFIRRRIVWVVLCVVLAAAVAYAYSKHKTKVYTATAALTFNTSQLDQEIAGLPTSVDVDPLAQQASNLELVSLGDVAAKTAGLLGHGLTAADVSSSLSVSGKGESNVVGISASSKSPTLAAAIANTYTSQFVKEQQSEDRAFFKSALAIITKQLAALPRAQRFGTDGLTLQDRADTLRFLASLGYNTVQIAQEALVPSSPSSPKNKRNATVGAILGLLLGLCVALLLERFDRRIREPKDLETIYGLPMLGAVPNSAALSRPPKQDGAQTTALPAAEAEAFSLIRAHLRFFNVERRLNTVVIASPAPSDGKTTIARYLAEAAARLGSNVLLLEVDLRHPTLAQQFGILPGPGLIGTLIGDVSIDDAVQRVVLAATPGEGISGRTLDVLLAGAVLPPNPGELLESRAMDALLERAKATYDLVVIDTPPLTAVSDAFPLLTKVDGVVIVGWVDRSRRDAAEGLQQILSGSGAPVLGVVANGAKPSGLGSYAESGSDTTSANITASNGASSPEGREPTVRS